MGEDDERDGEGDRGLDGDYCALEGAARGEGGGRVVVDYKEGDDDVLEGEEQVLPISREGEVVAVGIGEGDRVGQSLKYVGGEREAARGTCGNDCGWVQRADEERTGATY